MPFNFIYEPISKNLQGFKIGMVNTFDMLLTVKIV